MPPIEEQEQQAETHGDESGEKTLGSALSPAAQKEEDGREENGRREQEVESGVGTKAGEEQDHRVVEEEHRHGREHDGRGIRGAGWSVERVLGEAAAALGLTEGRPSSLPELVARLREAA